MKRYLPFILITATAFAQTPKSAADAQIQQNKIQLDLDQTRMQLEQNPLFVHWLALQGELKQADNTKNEISRSEVAAKRKAAREALDKAAEDKKKAAATK